MRQFLIRLTDRRLTVSLFLAFLVLFGLGLILPQRPQLLPGQAEAFAEQWPTLSSVARVSGLDDVYRSLAMRLVFGLCVLQLVAWLVLRSGPVIREALLPRTESPEQMPIQLRMPGDRGLLEAAATALRSRRFAVRETPGGYWYAAKNRISAVSSLAFHASFVILLGGAWLLKASSFRGSAILAEGQPFGGTLAEYHSVSPAGIREQDLPRIAFTPRRLQPVFSPEGRTSDMTCEALVGVEAGEVEAFAVNRPLRIGSASVLVHGFGLAPVFTVHSARTGQELDAVCVNLGVWAAGLPEDSFRLARPAATVQARFYPDHEEGPQGHWSRSMERVDPAMYVRVVTDGDGAVAAEGLLKVGEALEFGDHLLTLAELRTWGSFHVSRQSGWLLISGFLIMVASITLRFFFVPQAVSLRLRGSDQGQELVVGGRAAFFPEGLRYHLENLVAGARESSHSSFSNREESHELH